MDRERPVTLTWAREKEAEAYIGIVCDFYEITSDALKSDKKATDLIEARFAAMFLLKYKDFSLPQIGFLLERDHSTVINGIKRFRVKILSDQQVANHFTEVTEMISSGAPASN